MKKLISLWAGIILGIIIIWNTNCSGSLGSKTDVQILVTNWETYCSVGYYKFQYRGTNTNDITNYTYNYTNSRVSNYSWVYQFKPLGKYTLISFSNGTAVTQEGNYTINQFADKITMYSSETIEMSYILKGSTNLTLRDFKIYSNGTNYSLKPNMESNYGSGMYLMFYDIDYKLAPMSNNN